MNGEYDKLISLGCNDEQAAFGQMLADFSLRRISEIGYIMPHGVIKKPSNPETEISDIMMLEAQSFEGQAKDLFFETIRYLAHINEAEATALISETWMTPENVEGAELEDLIKKYGSVGNLPNKREGLTIAICNQNGDNAMILYEIIRDTEGAIAQIQSKSVNFQEEKLKGRVFSMFYSPEEKAHPKFKDRLDAMKIYASMTMMRAPKDEKIH